MPYGLRSFFGGAFLSGFFGSFGSCPPRTLVCVTANRSACSAFCAGAGVTNHPQNPGDPYATPSVGGWNCSSTGVTLLS